MDEHWNRALSEPLAYRRDGAARTLDTFADARELLSDEEPGGGSEGKLHQAATTAVSKAAESGQPSDEQVATEQMKVLLRSRGWI